MRAAFMVLLLLVHVAGLNLLLDSSDIRPFIHNSSRCCVRDLAIISKILILDTGVRQ